MPWLKDAIRKYLGVEETVKKEVRLMAIANERQADLKLADDILAYYEELNRTLYTGDPALIEKFYKETDHPVTTDRNDFWRIADNSIAKIHYPLASSISRTMSSVLFGEDLSFRVDTGNKQTSKQYEEIINDILKDNNIKELLQRGAQLESYSGSLAAKIVVDATFSDYPQIEFYAQEQFEIHTKYGKVYEIVFLDNYMQNERHYILNSTYGKGYITYELYDEIGQLVPLNRVDELADLKDVLVLGPDGEPIKVLLAAFKPNKPMSSQYNEKMYGASDYENLYGIFNSIDELTSTWSDYYRNGKIITFMSEDMLKRNPDTGEVIKPKTYGLNTVVMYDSVVNSEGKTEVKRDIPNLNIDAFRQGLENYIKLALTRAGLSPITFGLESATRLNSAETLQEREKTTLKTRQEKIKLWNEFLARLMRLLLVYRDMISLTPSMNTELEAITYRLTSEWEYKYLVEFPQYSTPSRQEQVRSLVEAKNGGLIDTETAMKELYSDEYSEEELNEMIARVKLEHPVNGAGMTQTMSFPLELLTNVGTRIERYADSSIPRSEDAYGKFMYFAELIKNGNIEVYRKDLGLLDTRYRAIIEDIVSALETGQIAIDGEDDEDIE